MANKEIKEHEDSFTIGLLGSNHKLTDLLGKAFGSPGTESDLQFYNRLNLQNKCIFTAVAPIGYPDKIKSLIQTCMLNQIHILVIDAETGITPEIGEIIVTMDMFKQYYHKIPYAVIGNINSQNEWKLPEIKKKFKKFIAATSLKRTPIMEIKTKQDYENLKTIIAKLAKENPPKKIDYGKVLIDHAFMVKGIGAVVLGLVQGKIEAGEMYELLPYEGKAKKTILRSIQKHDRDFKVSYPGDRVGLALKGVKSDFIDRNTVFAEPEIYELTHEAKIELNVSSFYKPQDGTIGPENTISYHIISNLGITPVKLVEGEQISRGKSGNVTIQLDKPLARDNDGLRGIVTYFEPFEGRLRVVGYFKQYE